MKHRLLFRGILGFVLAGFVVSSVYAQGSRSDAKKKPTQDEMMARWQETMTPGDAHKKLESFVGTWNAKIEVWMNGLDQPPAVSDGTSMYTMVLGGRYLREDVSAKMMDQPFSGIGFTGFDNFKKKYVESWIDNMGTGLSTMEGTMDRDGKALTMWGKMDEPMTGETDKVVKYVTRILDKDTHVFEIYDVTSYGENQPTMKITYTRMK